MEYRIPKNSITHTANVTLYNNDVMRVYAGGSADSTTVSRGGQMYVYSSGTVSTTSVLSEGYMYVSGGSAVSTTISKDGEMMVLDGGTAISTTVLESGWLYVASSATLNGATLYGGAHVTIEQDATVSDIVYQGWQLANNDTLKIKSSFSAMNTVVSSGGYLWVSSGGIASGTTVSSTYTDIEGIEQGGIMVLGGNVSDTIVLEGGFLTVLSGGSAIGTTMYGKTTVSSAAEMNVCSNGTASNTTLYGGQLDVYDNGTANNTTLSGGKMTIYDNGTASGTTVFNGGNLVVGIHGTAIDTVVSDGGNLSVQEGGVLNGATIYQGGWVNAADGAVVSNVVLPDWVLKEASVNVFSGMSVTNMTISNAGNLNLNGIASGTTVSGGGDLQICGGGTAIDTVVSDGGYLFVQEGGVLNGATIYQNGRAYAADGAIVSNAVFKDWVLTKKDQYNFDRLDVNSGFSALNTTVSSGGKLVVSSGGIATGIKHESGGLIDVAVADNDIFMTGTNDNGTFSYANGIASNFIVYKDASMHVSSGGVASDTLITPQTSMYVSSGGIAKGTTLKGKLYTYQGGTAVDTTANRGDLYVFSGGSATGTIMSNFGSMHVSSGGTVSGTMLMEYGYAYVSSGGSAVSTTVTNLGYLYVSSGGSASGTTVSSGGALSVSSGGSASGTTVLSGGYLYVSSDGTAGGITANKGGKVFLRDGASAGGAITVGGLISLEGAVSFAEGTSITLDVSGRSESDNYMVYGNPALLADVSLTLKTGTSQAPGTYKLVDGAAPSGIRIAVEQGGESAVIAADSSVVRLGTRKYALAASNDLCLTVASIPSIGVTALAAGVPSGTAKSGSWSYSFGDDVPGTKTVTVAGKALNLGTSTNTVAVAGKYGTLTVKADKTYSYKANPNAAGTDSFAFTIADADGDSANATLKVTVNNSTVKPAALSYSTSDAKLNTGVSKTLASGVTITQAAIDAVNKNISYGKFSLSGRNLIFTQSKAYTHASGAGRAAQKYSFDMKDANGNATKQDVTLTIADSTPSLSVSNITAPSGNATAGSWSYGFGGDVPGTKTVTVAGKALNLGTSTNTIAVAGTYGTLTVKANGTYSYAAKANAAGTDSFAFAIKDADGDSKSAALRVTAIDRTAPTLTSMSPAANAIGATMQFSEKMDASTIKSALTATLTGTGAKVAPTAVTETNAVSHIYSAAFATDYVGQYQLTLGSGAKDLAGNIRQGSITNVSNMTVTGATIASKAKQSIYAGGVASASKVSGQQLMYSGGRAVKSVVNKGGKLVLNKGGTANALTLAAGGKVQVNGGSLTGTTNLKGGTLTVAAAGTKVGAIKAAAKAVISLDLRKVKAGAKSAMLVAGAKSTLKNSVSILTNKLQALGSYKLSSAKLNVKSASFTVKAGSVAVKSLKLGGSAVVKNGVSYTVSTVKKIATLKLGVGAGSILNKDGKTIKGTANSDIFYAGSGKNTIKGINGRDVAVYDKNAWGKDTIAKTKGTMTLVLAGLKRSDVTTSQKKGVMTISKKSDKAQSITVKGWSAATHSIVYNPKASILKDFNAYLNTASPTETQKQAAQNSVFKAAKLA